jgi:FlaA1/EpsC-like NDP-sugar epimerase
MTTKSTYFIFGGAGSLGNALVQRYIDQHEIVVYSRDESKHWAMSIKYNHHPNLSFVIGDIRDKAQVSRALNLHRPSHIIIASAMKHVDKCERATYEAIQTNIIGIQNIIQVVQEGRYPEIQAVCFISTDKACSPVNVYGMCKAISENIVIEAASTDKTRKYVVVRYGNVLNSSGSIIPLLHKLGQDPNVQSFGLTHDHMTRFIMTLDHAVDLIHYAIADGITGGIIIPKLKSMVMRDLFEIFSEKYSKPISMILIRPGERLYEVLINDTQWEQMIECQDPRYMCILPFEQPAISTEKQKGINQYTSANVVVNKDILKSTMIGLSLL